MLFNPGLGLLDDDGELIPERAELAARALVKSVEIVCAHADLGDCPPPRPKPGPIFWMQTHWLAIWPMKYQDTSGPQVTRADARAIPWSDGVVIG